MDLIDRLKEKDERALSDLMRLHGDYLLRTSIMLLKDRHAAEEAVQDTFISAYEKIGQLTEAEKLKAWLTAILVNRSRAYMRKKNWKYALLSVEFFDHIMPIQEDSPEAALLQLAENQLLSGAIQRLDYKYREAIILFYFNEMKVLEISQLLNINENTVKARLSRGRLQLKEILLKGGDWDAAGQKPDQGAAGG